MAGRGSRSVVAIVSALLVAMLAVSVPGATAAAAATASARSAARTFATNCGDAVRRASPAQRGAPVLFVHGFAGAPSDFRRSNGSRPSMLATVRGLDGVVAYTFDYSAHSLEWVTDPDISTALGTAIVCLAREQGIAVTVVAHSMGGLATRQAQGEVVDGRPVGESLGTVVTVGTPFEGTQLLGFADGPAGDVLADALDAGLRACTTDLSPRPRRTLCDLLGTAETAAVRAMVPGSAELRALPRWTDAVRVVPIAADIEVGIEGPLGFSERFSVGDIAVSVDSARADASRGSRPFVARCHASLLDLVDAIDDSACSHANEIANRRIIREVRDRVARAVARARQTMRRAASPPSSGITEPLR